MTSDTVGGATGRPSVDPRHHCLQELKAKPRAAAATAAPAVPSLKQLPFLFFKQTADTCKTSGSGGGGKNSKENKQKNEPAILWAVFVCCDG